MCGRYTVFTQSDDSLMLTLLEQAGFTEMPSDICPTDPAPILAMSDCKVRSRFAYWGLPSPENTSRPVINSRSETAAVKKFFRDALFYRRCVIPATGFYEWSRETKLKYLFTPRDDEMIFMAGAYNEYGPVKKFVIFTREADEDISDIHNRMPVLLPQERVKQYLTDTSYYEKAFITAPLRIVRTLSSV